MRQGGNFSPTFLVAVAHSGAEKVIVDLRKHNFGKINANYNRAAGKMKLHREKEATSISIK